MSPKPGPITEAGKHTVSQNALKTGLASIRPTHYALHGESETFTAFARGIIEDLTPVGATEESLAADIAGDRYRLIRARKMENALFSALEVSSEAPTRAAANAESFVDATKGIQKIALYANRIQRAIERNSAKLEALQTARKEAFNQAQQEAILLTELAQSTNKPYDPLPDFPAGEYFGHFVYSAVEITRLIARTRRLDKAKSRLAQAA